MADTSGVIAQGNPRWEGMMRQWERESRPAQISSGGLIYAVIQNAQTNLFEFRPVSPQDLYNSISWGK